MKSHNASSPELSLIVPTYNESENIKTLVERVHKSLSDYNYELIVVDDNSPDGTAELAKSLSSKYPVRVIVRTNERGLASAVVAGFKQAKGDILGVIDADLQHPPEFVPNLIKGVKEGADVAIASRYIKGGAIEGWTLKRKIISLGAKLPANVLLTAARKIKDPLSGFFLFRKQVIEGTELSPTGYKILLEVLVKGKPARVVEIPYTFRERERGKSNLTAKEQINYLKHLYRLAWYDGGIRRFIKFCVVGASGTGVYLGLLTLFTEVAGLRYMISAAIAYEISIITNFLLNEFWTFSDRRTPGIRSFFIRGIKFNLVSLVGLGIHEGVLIFFTDVVGFFYIISAIFGIASAMLWNFFSNLTWTWRVKTIKEG